MYKVITTEIKIDAIKMNFPVTAMPFMKRMQNVPSEKDATKNKNR